MPGLINGARATQFNPAQRQIDPELETVEGRATKLVSSDSPFITQARARSTEAANARGLVNSSIAAQAGESAAYSAAIPIAGADAAAYQTASRDNQAALNTAGQFNAGAENQFALQDVQGKQQIEQIGASGGQQRQTQELVGGQQRALQAQQAESEAALQTLKGTQQTALVEKQAALEQQTQLLMQNLRGDQAQQLAEIEASYKTLMQTNDSAGKLFQQTTDSISKILVDNNLSADAKNAAIQRQSDLLRSGLTIIGKVSNIPDLPELLDFSGAPPTVPGA